MRTISEEDTEDLAAAAAAVANATTSGLHNIDGMTMSQIDHFLSIQNPTPA